MIFWGVKLPDITEEDEEVDMDVDQAHENYAQNKFKDPVGSRMNQNIPTKEFEEVKVSHSYSKKSAAKPIQEEYRYSTAESHAVPPAKGDSFDRSSISHVDPLDKTTFKVNPDNTPADLDFDDFISKTNLQDSKYIDKILEKHHHFIDNLKQRNQKINNILSLYSPYKNLNMTLSALDQMNDIGVTNDVISALFVEGKFVDNLTMKHCLNSIGYCESLFNGKHENHVITGAKSILKILKHIGQDIITMRNTQVSHGVDLQREERLKVCNDLLDFFLKIFKGKTIQKRCKYPKEIGKVSKLLYSELHNFLALADTNGGNNRQAELA